MNIVRIFQENYYLRAFLLHHIKRLELDDGYTHQEIEDDAYIQDTQVKIAMQNYIMDRKVSELLGYSIEVVCTPDGWMIGHFHLGMGSPKYLEAAFCEIAIQRPQPKRIRQSIGTTYVADEELDEFGVPGNEQKPPRKKLRRCDAFIDLCDE